MMSPCNTRVDYILLYLLMTYAARSAHSNMLVDKQHVIQIKETTTYLVSNLLD